jgi:meso-butanediol dehydrogenase / (S,S)-butanediol dehydrogenase / diacetyl reductase
MHDRVVFISGTARGQGRVAALRFAAAGATVVGGDVLAEEAARTVDLVRRAGGSMVDVGRLDVTDESSVQAWVTRGVEATGRLDVLYNNAGAVRFVPLREQSFDDWRFTLSAELDSVFLACRAAWSHLEASSGCVVNVGSTAGLTGSMSNPRTAHTASKGGVIAVTRQLAAEGAPLGIRVNCISPGLIDTEGTRESILAADHPMHRAAATVPLGRLGTADDVVSAALFLASSGAAYITAANLVVDGGWSAVVPWAPS